MIGIALRLKMALYVFDQIPMTNLKTNNKASKRLYVISDLHLGGDYGENSDSGRGFRICTHVRELTAFVRALTARAVRTLTDTELVINGDLVDFLAETREVRDPVSGKVDLGWQPFVDDPSEATKLFKRIVQRDEEFFAALRELLAAGIRLTITLGNHDIELGFPAVRRFLTEVLAADGRRFSIIYDGEAYRVGSVLIEHGNRYDEWNVVSHDGFRRLRSVQSRMEPSLDSSRDFEAPAGSFLVAGVMNEIKTRYPFIDLLKPESQAAIPILMALAPEYRSRIVTIASLVARSRKHLVGIDGLPSNAGDIAEHEPRAEVTGEAIIKEILQDRKLLDLFDRNDTSCPLGVAEQEQFRGDAGSVDFRSLWSLVRLTLARPNSSISTRLPTLLTALRAVQDDFSFDRQREITQYREAAERLLSYGSKIVLFGHTHLAKRIEFDRGLYINSGTWADLLPFPSTILAPDPGLPRGQDIVAVMLSRLERFVEDMRTARLRSYLQFIPTYARIEFDEKGEPFDAQLYEYSCEAEDV
ncbi:metallophosphoesterase [Bradyrhizobium sp. 1.29L]